MSASNGSAVARLAGVSYWYPNRSEPSLREVDLTIEPGLTLLAGDSGGGKSTLLRLFDGLVPQFHGGRDLGPRRGCGAGPVPNADPAAGRARRARLPGRRDAVGLRLGRT